MPSRASNGMPCPSPKPKSNNEQDHLLLLNNWFILKSHLMVRHKKCRRHGASRPLIKHDPTSCPFTDLLDYFEVMLNTGQPGELPLMRELTALNRARSLQDPSTVKSPAFDLPPSQAPSNPTRKSPLRGFTSHRGVETGRAGQGRGSHNVTGQLQSQRHARKVARKSTAPLPKATSPDNVTNAQAGWDLGIAGTGQSSDTRQEGMFGGTETGRSPNLHEASPKKQTQDVNDDEYSLQNWTSVRWPAHVEAEQSSKMECSDGQRNVGGPPTAPGSDAFEFRNQGGSRKPSSDKRGLKQSSQILSPLTLNSQDDTTYAGGQHMSMFSLEEPSYEDQEQRKEGVKAEVQLSNPGASSSPSPYAREGLGRSGQGAASKKSRQSQYMLTSSSNTSQRTVSQGSLPAWETSLDDELDVSDLPRNACGMPCHWSKGRQRMKNAGKSSIDPPSRHEKSNTDTRSMLQAIHREDKEVAPLVTEPSAASDNGGMPPRGGRTRRDTSEPHGELGNDAPKERSRSVHGSAHEKAGMDSTSDGKELAVFVERPRSLSQKYRPKSFDELIGQSLVTHALSNAIAKGKVAPVYLFQGPRGTGKTSAARIFAAALNCVALGLRKPCGVCFECTTLALGKVLHVHEIDAASHNGLENAKALLQSTMEASSGSRYKVFIIDECHMLTSETWNALLKMLEEPPRNAVVILITTDPEKLPRTAASRCQKFLFPKIRHADVVSRLAKLVKLEKLDVEPGALNLIATKSEGSLRDAETILDQLSLLGQRITINTIHELVGSVSDDKLLSLLDLALCSDTVSTVRRARELIDSGVEPLDLMSQLATLITDILAGSYEIMNRDRKSSFFSSQALSEVEMERLSSALKILSETEKQLREASKDRTTWLTAALLRFGPGRLTKVLSSSTSVSAPPSPTSRFSQTARKLNEARAYRMRRVETRKRHAPAKGSNFKEASRSTKSSYRTRVHPTDQSSPHDASREFSTESSVAESPFSSEGLERHANFKSPGNLGSIWLNVIEGCGSIPLRQLLQYHGKLLAVSFSPVDAVAHLEFAKPEHKHRAERYRKSIANAFKKVLGLPVEVKVSLASLPPPSVGLGHARLWASAADPVMQARARPYYVRHGKDEHLNREEYPEVGSLSHWRSHGGVSHHKLPEPPTTSVSIFPAIPLYPSATVPAPPPLSRRPAPSFRSTVESRYVEADALSEERGMQNAWVPDASKCSSPRFFTHWQQKPRFSGEFGREMQHENEFATAVGGFHAQKYRHSSCGDSKSPAAYPVEEENLRLESTMKYGGLLCWKAPRMEHEKGTKHRRRRKHGILIRLMPCARWRSPCGGRDDLAG